jgi:hypothetical protein
MIFWMDCTHLQKTMFDGKRVTQRLPVLIFSTFLIKCNNKIFWTHCTHLQKTMFDGKRETRRRLVLIFSTFLIKYLNSKYMYLKGNLPHT